MIKITYFLRAATVLATAGILLTGCSLFASKAANKACAAGAADMVCTAYGAVNGVVEGDTVAFKGIPYATPPVEKLRWQAPQPAKPWVGVRDGSKFGAICPQMDSNAVIGNEDCLTLNVWRPAGDIKEPLAVMIFLPGGGNFSLSGQGTNGFGGVKYNGGQLVPQGVIFVSFNYRLGALGFLAHPKLNAEHPFQVSGNYGSQDQIAMLRWVQENIAAFGGDPKRVMLFGTSAGGGNICALLTAPTARGTFQSAAMQSSVPTGCELPTMADAQNSTGMKLEQKLDCANVSSSACLRSKSAEDIVRALPGSFGMQPRDFGPNVDGYIFPAQPIEAIRHGAYMKMPLIIGNSSEETMQWAAGLGKVTDTASYAEAIAKSFGDDAVQRIISIYPLASYPTTHAAMVQVTTDVYFTCQSLRVATALATSQSEPVYRYVFAHALNNDATLKAQGSIHTIEHAFLFPWTGKYFASKEDQTLQKTMVTYWTSLAKTGMLAGQSPKWPAADGFEHYLELGNVIRVRQDDDAHCDFWDSVKLPSPHL